MTMPAVVSPSPARRRFTVAEYYRMADAGILAWDSNRPGDRVERLDGDVIHRVIQKLVSRHASLRIPSFQ